MTGKIEISIEDYLSEQEMHDVALDVFRTMVAESLRRQERYFGGVGSFVSNMAYCTVLEECGRYVEGGAEAIRERIAEQVDRHIGDLSAFMIYRYDYDTGEPRNGGARIVEAAIAENRQAIEARVCELLEEVPARELRDSIAATVEEFADKWFRGDGDD